MDGGVSGCWLAEVAGRLQSLLLTCAQLGCTSLSYRGAGPGCTLESAVGTRVAFIVFSAGRVDEASRQSPDL